MNAAMLLLCTDSRNMVPVAHRLKDLCINHIIDPEGDSRQDNHATEEPSVQGYPRNSLPQG